MSRGSSCKISSRVSWTSSPPTPSASGCPPGRCRAYVSAVSIPRTLSNSPPTPSASGCSPYSCLSTDVDCLLPSSLPTASRSPSFLLPHHPLPPLSLRPALSLPPDTLSSIPAHSGPPALSLAYLSSFYFPLTSVSFVLLTCCQGDVPTDQASRFTTFLLLVLWLTHCRPNKTHPLSIKGRGGEVSTSERKTHETNAG